MESHGSPLKRAQAHLILGFTFSGLGGTKRGLGLPGPRRLRGGGPAESAYLQSLHSALRLRPAPRPKFRLPPPWLPASHSLSPILSSHAAKGISLSKEIWRAPSRSTAPDKDQAPHSPEGPASGLCPPVHPHLPRLLSIADSCLRISSPKVNSSPSSSCQPFPQQGTCSHLLHFQRKPTKPLSLEHSSPTGEAGLDERMSGREEGRKRGRMVDRWMDEAAGLRRGRNGRTRSSQNSLAPLPRRASVSPRDKGGRRLLCVPKCALTHTASVSPAVHRGWGTEWEPRARPSGFPKGPQPAAPPTVPCP